MTPLDSLIGATVVRVEELHDYVQLLFDANRMLTIFNEMNVSDELPQSLRNLVGTHLARVEEQQAKVTFNFDNGTELSVNLSDDAYRGPEAMHLMRPGQPMVVW
ncbi:MAG: hypothetical protein M3Y59_16035 [Myxococcota bacterium]|nr:hypothetical protein [Myxococcota bacterium]